MKLKSQEMRKLAPELDPLRIGTGWTKEDLDKVQVMVESTYGDSHPGSGHLNILVEEVRKGIAEEGGSVQIGYQFPMTNSLKGVGVFCNIKIEQFSMGTSTNDGKNFYKREGFNLGVGLTTKFIFGSINSLVPRDTIIGFGLGAKVLVAPKIDFVGFPPPITPYVDLFVEQRFFVARKLALVCGINVGIDLMIYQPADPYGYALFGHYGAYMMFPAYPSLSIGLNIGLHFGN